MSKNKNDKNTKITFGILVTKVGLAACALASVAVIAEAFEARVHKATLPIAATYGHAADYGAGHHQTDMRKEEIRHMHVSYGVHMRSQPVAGSI